VSYEVRPFDLEELACRGFILPNELRPFNLEEMSCALDLEDFK
jgi:hypothetical protein